MMNIPNILTGVRFLLIGVFGALFFSRNLPGHRIYALGIFLLAGLTDVLDGYIARRYGQVTEWGKLLDPLADKLLLVTVLICLSVENIIPFFVILIVIVKEMMMIFGAAFLFRSRRRVIQANRYGKAATVLFYLAITLLIIELPMARLALAVAVVFTLMTFLQYYLYHFRAE